MKKTIEIACKSCKGTGLYSGMCESDNCAVVCTRCDGTGKDILTYEPFEKRKLRKGIKRVFKNSGGYKHGAYDHTTEAGLTIKFSEGGCTYEEWLNGEAPKPVKELYCPFLWTSQNMQNKSDKNYKLYKARCEPANLWGERIMNCCHYTNKDECWKLFKR